MNNRKLALLLLIPAVGIFAKSRARRYHWRNEEFAGGAGFRPPFGRGPMGWRGSANPGEAPHLPPWIEATLERWHRAAHGGEVSGTTADVEV